MKETISCKCTLWIGRAIALAVGVLCFTMYDLLVWYAGLRCLPWQVCAVILAGFYCCVPGILLALWSMDQLLRGILLGRVFTGENVRLIRRIRNCCAGVSLICLPAAVFYPPLIFLSVIMAFLALAVGVVKNVMAAAVALREENDLTI